MLGIVEEQTIIVFFFWKKKKETMEEYANSRQKGPWSNLGPNSEVTVSIGYL